MAVFLPSYQITALHARHKRTLFCRELPLVSLSCPLSHLGFDPGLPCPFSMMVTIRLEALLFVLWLNLPLSGNKLLENFVLSLFCSNAVNRSSHVL